MKVLLVRSFMLLFFRKSQGGNQKKQKDCGIPINSCWNAGCEESVIWGDNARWLLQRCVRYCLAFIKKLKVRESFVRILFVFFLQSAAGASSRHLGVGCSQMWMFSKLSHVAAGREGKVLWDKSPPHEQISLRPVGRACVSRRHAVCARRSNVKLVLQRILSLFFFFKAAKPAQNRLCWGEKGGALILWIGEQESRRRWEARVVFAQHAESNLPKLLLCFFRLHRPLLLFRCNLDNEVNTNCLQPFYWQHALCFEFLMGFFKWRQYFS